MGLCSEVLEYINTPTFRWQAYLIRIFVIMVFAAVTFFRTFFLKKQSNTCFWQHVKVGEGGIQKLATQTETLLKKKGLVGWEGEWVIKSSIFNQTYHEQTSPFTRKNQTSSAYIGCLQSHSWYLSLCVLKHDFFFCFSLHLSSRISYYSTAVLSQYVMWSEPLGNLL